MRKSYDYLSITYMSFTSPLLNVWKFFGKLKKKHPRVQKQTFQQVSKFFWKSSKIFKVFGKNQRMSQSTQNNLLAFFIFLKKIFRNCWRSSEKIRKCRKVLKMIFQQIVYIFRNAWKTLETLRKFSNVIGGFYETFKSYTFNLLHLWTEDWIQ